MLKATVIEQLHSVSPGKSRNVLVKPIITFIAHLMKVFFFWKIHMKAIEDVH